MHYSGLCTRNQQIFLFRGHQIGTYLYWQQNETTSINILHKEILKAQIGIREGQIEIRTGQIEIRTGQIEIRIGQIETRKCPLEISRSLKFHKT